MSAELHAIAQLTSDTHHRIVPQKVIDHVASVLAERDAEENELREALSEERARRARADNLVNEAREDLAKSLGTIQELRIQNRSYRIRLGLES